MEKDEFDHLVKKSKSDINRLIPEERKIHNICLKEIIECIVPIRKTADLIKNENKESWELYVTNFLVSAVLACTNSNVAESSKLLKKSTDIINGMN